MSGASVEFPERVRTQPLAGMRIVEVSSYVATPLCGLALGQLGADVIRVEPIGGAPDRTRWPLSDGGQSLYWDGLNRGKRAIAVDLEQPAGRELVADLLVRGGERGGILVTNSDRWPELGYPALRALRPDVIHVTLVGGHGGERAVDYTVQAGTGFPMVTGPAVQTGVVNHVLPAWDLAAGLYLATGLLAAQVDRQLTGRGSQVRVALEDVALATAGQLGYLAEAQLSPDKRRGADDNYVFGTFGRDFVTTDAARFMIVALTPRHWADLLHITQLEDPVRRLEHELGADFGQEGERYAHRVALAGLIEAWFAEHTSAVVEALLAETRLLWSRYRTFQDLGANGAELLRSNPLFSVVEQPGVGSIVAPSTPITVDGRRVAPQPAPRPGQDTRAVLTSMGIASERVAALAAGGVVACADPRGVRHGR